MTPSVRVRRAAIMASHNSSSRATDLLCSPAGTVWTAQARPAPSRLFRTVSAYRGPTVLSVTTKTWAARGSRARTRSPVRERSPRSISMS